MARKITDEDLANRGVMGLPDVPGLTAIEMQKKLEEIPREVIIPRYNELVDSVTSICDEFSKLNSYAVGDYCIYQNKLYKCNTATNGDWDASKWTETSVGDELKSVNSNLGKTIELNVNISKGESITDPTIDKNVISIKVFGEDSSISFCAEGLPDIWYTDMYYTNRMIQFRADLSTNKISCGNDTYSQAKITKIILYKK